MVFAVIGGDERMVFLARRLREDGHRVRMCGFETYPGHIPSVSAGDALFGAECVILPLPSTKDGSSVWTPFSDNVILLSDLKNAAPRSALFLTACIKLGVAKECDYFAREELTVLNAIPTVEGAIEEAMRATDHTLWHSSCLVVGFGRIGKLLCHRLAPFGCKIAATARRPEVHSWISAYGYESIDHRVLHERIGEFPLVFNTVPNRIIGEKELQAVGDGSVIIELASAPYGVDPEAAKKAGVRLILASGLPSKTAPRTAADIIYGTVGNILNEML